MPDRQFAPVITQALEFDIKLTPYNQFILPNRIPVYYLHGGPEEVVSIELVFKAGSVFEDHPLVADATGKLLKNGTDSKTALQVNEYFEYYGAYIQQRIGSKTATIQLYCLNKYLPELLPLVREIITRANFPQRELEIYKNKSRQRLKVNLEKCDFVANRYIGNYLYGMEHPYGKNYHAGDIDSLQSTQLQAFFDRYYVNGSCSVFAAGKLPAHFEKLMHDHFGDLSAGSAITMQQVSLEPASEKQYRITNDPNGVQGAIRIARLMPSSIHPDFKKLQILNTLFGGYFGSRLMANIREEKGYTYGVYSYFESRTDVSAQIISTEAGKGVCEAAVQEIYLEMNKLREQIPPTEELELVKNYMLGQYLSYTDGPFQTMSRWRNLITQGLDGDYFDAVIDTIRSVTPQEIHEIADKYFSPDAYFELIVV